MRTNQEMKNSALNALRGNWAPAVLATLVYLVLAVILSENTSILNAFGISIPVNASFILFGGTTLVAILFTGPLGIGYNNSLRVLYQTGDNMVIKNMFDLTFNNWKHIVLGYLLMEVKIILWTFCLIIPGIVKSFAYAMTPFVLVDNPELGVKAAIERSENLMRGHKFDLFYLYLTFIGWFILSVITCGIGFFWLCPYTSTTLAAFYNDLKVEFDSSSL